MALEPVPEVPVSVTVYVPAGVPEFPLAVLLTPPPQALHRRMKSIVIPRGRRAFRRLPAMRLATKVRATSHICRVSATCPLTRGKTQCGVCPGPSIEPAAVVTISEAVDALGPLGVTEFGEIEQVAACGAPPQVSVTV